MKTRREALRILAGAAAGAVLLPRPDLIPVTFAPVRCGYRIGVDLSARRDVTAVAVKMDGRWVPLPAVDRAEFSSVLSVEDGGTGRITYYGRT